MDVRSKVYTYHTSVKWTEQRKGVISCAASRISRLRLRRSSRDMQISGRRRIYSSRLPISV